VTPLDYIEAHPVWTCILLAVSGNALAAVVRAAVEPLRSWKRPGDCPRCDGTGRDP
jgi:hypothetical protein